LNPAQEGLSKRQFIPRIEGLIRGKAS